MPWSEHVQPLEAALRDGELGAELTRVANAVLVALRNDGLLGQLTQEHRLHEKPNTDNPHIYAGAILASLARSRSQIIRSAMIKYDHWRDIEAERRRVHAIQHAISSIIRWLQARQHPIEPGYLLRWDQVHPDERRSTIDSYAEPSLDEYSGLILGLTSVCGLGSSPWCHRTHDAATLILSQISSYLRWTNGWLVRPVQRDLTLRGPALAANSYPLGRVFADLHFHDRFANYRPLMISRDVEGFIENSQDGLRSLREGGADCAHAEEVYEKTIRPLVMAKEIAGTTRFVKWAGLLTAAAGVLTGSLDFGLAAVAAGSSALAQWGERRIEEVSDQELWNMFGLALGPGAADAGGYNLPIFDRFCLAGFTPHEFQKRSERKIDGGERYGWAVFGIACRLWFSQGVVSADECQTYIKEMGRSIRALAPTSGAPAVEPTLEAVEGFLLGWSMLCVLFDIDPRIRWEDVIDPPWSSLYGPEDLPSPRSPRLRTLGTSIRVLKTHKDQAWPTLWMIPLIVEESDGLPFRLLQLEKASDAYIAGEYDKEWVLSNDEAERSYMLMVVGWDVLKYIANPDEPENSSMATLVDPDDHIAEMLREFDRELRKWATPESSFEELEELVPYCWECAAARAFPEGREEYVGAKILKVPARGSTDDDLDDATFELRRHNEPQPNFTSLSIKLNVRIWSER